jgi:3-oxoadipate enol-lactonase
MARCDHARMALIARLVSADNREEHRTEQGPPMTVEVELPPGRHIELPGRGTTFVRDVPGPGGAPTLLLLHGWTANADLNWRTAYAALSEHYRLVALDHRGHARGIRAEQPFRLEDCADDAAALVEHLGVGSVIAVGYSMGGPVAQLLWQRHPELVEGLVLCATSQTFNGTPRERALFGIVSGACHLTAERRAALAMRVLGKRHPDIDAHDWVAIVEAARELGRFDSRSWLPTVDVPTSVVVTTRDRVVPAVRQLDLAAAIHGATVHPVCGDHAVCLAHAEAFVPRLAEAVRSVVGRTRRPLLAA